MAAMTTRTSSFDVRSATGWFRIIALAEAATWVGLLLGMYFKYLGSPRTEIGVKVFGPVHGAIFIAFVVAALLTGIAVRWGLGTWLLALLGSVVPLGSVMFLIWADRTGRMGPQTGPESGLESAPAGSVRAGRRAPETT